MRRGSRLPLETLAPYLLQVPDPPKPLDLSAVFGNNRPIEIEVGFGKGLFLLTSALAYAQTNFLGIEIERKYQLFTANRIAKRNLTNVRLVQADARNFLRDCIPAASVQAIHVYFPDPWWKKRHQKRRVFTAFFVGECARVLQSGGYLHVATDVEAYFRVILDLLRQQSPLREQASLDADPPSAAFTNFERKARERGQPIFRIAFQRH
ncbi:MAG TPA: tRNA (guanosine(46)-N7)-methyltransferase TrmB [Gemmataceae bacterium]